MSEQQPYTTRNINDQPQGPTKQSNNGQGAVSIFLNKALSEGPKILENPELLNQTTKAIMQGLDAIYGKNTLYIGSKHYIAIQTLLAQNPVNHSIVLLSIFLLSQEMNTHNIRGSIYKGAKKIYIPDDVAKGLADIGGIISTIPTMTISGLAHSSIALQPITQPFVAKHKKIIIKTLTALLSRYTKTPMQQAMMQAVIKKLVDDMAIAPAKSTMEQGKTTIHANAA